MPIVILKDDNGKPVIDPLTGDQVKVDVSKNMAKVLEKDDRYLASQHNNDQQRLQIIHFDTPAWENMLDLSTKYSAEDECLNASDEIAAAEHAHYLKRRARCRRAYRMLHESCTPTQWRRFELYYDSSLTIREIAQKEKKSIYAIQCSLVQVARKLEKILSDLSEKI